MKKTTIMIIIIALMMGMIPAYGSENISPVLISSELTSTNENSIRGYIVSYEDNILVIESQSKPEEKIMINDSDSILESNYPNAKSLDFIELSTEMVDDSLILIEVISFSPIMDIGNESEDTSSEEIQVMYNENPIYFDVEVQIIDGVVMVPLRKSLEIMGYTITWNQETKSVDIVQGAQFTSVKIGENKYIKNKMTPFELSAAPKLIDNRTLVPLEFIIEVLGKSISVENGQINIKDEEPVSIEGYVKSIEYDETGSMIIVITSNLNSEDESLESRVYTSDTYTYYQGEVEEGMYVNISVSDDISEGIPSQTSGYLVY